MTFASSENDITAEEFKHAFRLHPGGVAIVTADIGDGPKAMTITSMFSVSVDPPTLVFSASAMSSSTPTVLSAETVVVHMLSSDDIDLAKLCATSGSARFGDEVDWDRLPTGEPFYPRSSSWIRGRVVDRVNVHGSVLVVVEALEAKPPNEDSARNAVPLIYHNRNWFGLGGSAIL
ncbi:flavin reductase family protein [Rhodococcus sp. 1R11]|uniref:flavin reductase family protein n=1 Tax=Rhodococcus sp. 1R11 TaxID=2559614 RepID=UPI00246916A2|nr:flavin reductase family protein [Rhodococcus sp. 1R11]